MVEWGVDMGNIIQSMAGRTLYKVIAIHTDNVTVLLPTINPCNECDPALPAIGRFYYLGSELRGPVHDISHRVD